MQINMLMPFLLDGVDVVFLDFVNRKVYNIESKLLSKEIADQLLQAIKPEEVSMPDNISTIISRQSFKEGYGKERMLNARSIRSKSRDRDNGGGEGEDTVFKETDSSYGDKMD